MFDSVGEFVNDLIRQRSQLQGHTLTGKFEAGLTYKVERTGEGWEVVGYDATGVGKYLDKETPAVKIPYSPGSGATKSAFIDGLTRYAELRFKLSGKEALRAAFAMAVTMKREGKPTVGSYKYSSNNRRTGVISDTINENWDKIVEKIDETGMNIISKQVEILLQEWQ
jgi:hypothetical protein